MRYTPGRFGSDAISSRASNVAGAAGSISEWDEAMVRSGSAHARSFPFEMAGNRKLIEVYARIIKELTLFRRRSLAEQLTLHEHAAIVERIAVTVLDLTLAVEPRDSAAHAVHPRDRIGESEVALRLGVVEDAVVLELQRSESGPLRR